MSYDRRAVLKGGAGLLAAGSLAGCIGDLTSGSGEGEGVQASFYLLYDFADQVAGDRTEVESIVPFGQHGHGWQPSGQIQKDIYESRAFVYVEEGFQPWADDVVQNLESDDAGVEIIAAREGIDLLPMDGSHGHDHGEGEHEDEEHDSHDEEEHDEEHDSHDEEEHDEEHDSHDDLQRDPHFWLDPLRAKEAVDNIRDGLIAADSDGEAQYREQADAYRSDIDALDERFESELAGASQEHVLVAGHNAFQYLGTRYGFTVHALSGISPDENPSSAARSEAQQVIEEYGIEYVLAPTMESDQAAQRLVEDTDATEVIEISALSGVREEWVDDGWGYLDVMENVNLPALRKALHAE
jgi:zinc transport system substrate-binding protein